MNNVKNIAIVAPVIPIYRKEFFKRIATFNDFQITCFHSPGSKYGGAKSIGNNFAIKNKIVKTLYYPKSPKIFYQGVLKEILFSKYDVVICIQNIHNLTTFILWFFHFFRFYKFIWWGIGFDPYRQIEPSKRPEKRIDRLVTFIRNFVFKNASALFLYSEKGKAFTKNIGVPEENIYVLQNSLDVEHLKKYVSEISQNQIDQLRKKLGIFETTFVYLFVGRLHKRKEVDFLLRSFNLIKNKIENAKVIIIGDGEEKENIVKLINDLNLNSLVTMTGAIYDHIELAKYFLISRVTTLPGQVGLTIVHSFAYGKAIISRKSDSYSPELEYLQHNINGVYLEDSSLDAYANQLLKCYKDKKFMEKLEQGVYNTIQNISINKMTEAFRNAINSLV